MQPNSPWASAQRTNRRRLLVFLGSLTVALAVSLAFTWLRPPEYRASARLEITPAVGAVASRPAPAGESESVRPFLTEVQALTSRPVLEQAALRLARAGQDTSMFGSDPIAGMQAAVEALPVAGTNVVELVATGPHAGLLASLLNAVIEVYQDRLAETFRSSSGEWRAQADDEVNKLEGRVAAKRRDVESFRIRNNIVSLERGENEVLARVRNLSTSLSAANDRVAAAEGKLRALNASAATGKAIVRARDDPTLANLEQRASQIREELRDLERGFTPDYLAKDPKVIAQRTRLAELDRQISVQRAASQQSTLLEAQEELASAQGAAARIQNEMSTGRQEVAQFTTRFNEYKSRQDELAELESAHRDAVQRRAKLEASERTRMPATKVLEAAATPQEPWRPQYWRDTALSVGGSLALALLAMWLVELFNRPEPRPAVVLIQPQAGALQYESLPQALAGRSRPGESLEATEPALLPRQSVFPRELRHDEVAALIAASDDNNRLVMLLLLSGVSLEEALKLRWSDVDPVRSTLHVGDEFARDIALGGALQARLAAGPRSTGSDLLVGYPGRPVTRAAIDAQILYAAHDAGIEDANEITSDCLRHTYVAFLVRQGIRFADLMLLVGQVPPELVGAYSALSPAGARSGIAEIELLHPGLRERKV